MMGAARSATAIMRMPWKNLPDALKVSLFMGLVEFLRSGFFVGFFPLFGLEVLKIPLSYVGFLTTLHYGTEAGTRIFAVWLANRFALGVGFVLSAVLAFASFYFFLWSPPVLYPLWAVTWGLALAPLWPRIAAYLRQLARPGFEGRSVSYAWLIIGPLIAAGSFGVGFLSKHDLAWGKSALLFGSVLMLAAGLALFNLRFSERLQKPPPKAWRRYLPLLVPAFLQALAPHLLTTVLFPFLKQSELGVQDVAWPLALSGLLFLAAFRFASVYADQKDPANVVTLAAVFAMVGFGVLGFLPTDVAVDVSIPAIGVALGLYLPGWNAVIVRALPEGERGEGWATLSTASGAAFALGPFVGALAWDLIGPQGPFRLGLFLLALLIPYYQLYFRRLLAHR